MSMENYTQKALEALRDAHTLARENENQYLTPAHLLAALLEQEGGLVGSLLERMGTDCGALRPGGAGPDQPAAQGVRHRRGIRLPRDRKGPRRGPADGGTAPRRISLCGAFDAGSF